MADRLDNRQLDNPARQQAQRPVRVALRGRPQTQGDDLRLLFAVQPLEARGQRPPFACQRPLEPLLHASLPNVLDRLGPAGKASATCWSVHPGPSASAFNRICARRTFSLLPLSLRTVCRQISRSSSVSRTMYFFCGMKAVSARDQLYARGAADVRALLSLIVNVSSSSTTSSVRVVVPDGAGRALRGRRRRHPDGGAYAASRPTPLGLTARVTPAWGGDATSGA